MKRPDLRRDGLESVEEAAAEPPAAAVVPGSIEWASAVGNQAVARLAASQAGEQEQEEEASTEEMAPEDGEAAAAMADVDEEQLPES
jgi:hypothetical protein